MRLTCPNCGAQYEVPDDVIPEEGRDVQCSNCGDTWFQHPAGFTPAAETEEAATSEAPSPDMTQTEAPPSPSQQQGEAEFPSVSGAEAPVAKVEIASESAADVPVSGDDTDPEEVESTDAAPQAEDPGAQDQYDQTEAMPAAEEASAPQSPRGLDPALSDILREEAERDASLRAADQNQSQSLEIQPNLGLDDLPENDEARRNRQAQDRMARIRGEDPRRLAAEASGLKRGVLPDIEEINSTLRHDQTPSGVDPDSREELGAGGARKQSRGFRRGFLSMLVLFVLLVMLYVYADQIAATVPALAGILAKYVAGVDHLRLLLDGQITALLSWLDMVATESAN